MVKSNDPAMIIKQFVDVFLSTNGDGYALDVPKDMRSGQEDSDGWCGWKAIDSSVTTIQLDEIEENIGFKLPKLLRCYFSYKALLMTEFIVNLPQTPSSSPLNEFRQYIELFETDFKFKQLFPFAYDSNDSGPVCLDISSGGNSERFPVVIFDYSKMNNVHNYRGDVHWETIEGLFNEIILDLSGYD